jgi:hypothetical protein
MGQSLNQSEYADSVNACQSSEAHQKCFFFFLNNFESRCPLSRQMRTTDDIYDSFLSLTGPAGVNCRLARLLVRTFEDPVITFFYSIFRYLNKSFTRTPSFGVSCNFVLIILTLVFRNLIPNKRDWLQTYIIDKLLL